MWIHLNRDGQWYTSDENNVFHLYSSFGKKESDTREQKISIFGLTLSYKEKDGSLVLEEQDYRRAKKTFPALLADLKGLRLAHIKELSKGSLAKRTEDPSAQPPKPVPCQAKWSNALRMELEDMKGKCLHFTAASSGTIYVLFSAKPSDKEKRYGVEISPDKARMFKVFLRLFQPISQYTYRRWLLDARAQMTACIALHTLTLFTFR